MQRRLSSLFDASGPSLKKQTMERFTITNIQEPKMKGIEMPIHEIVYDPEETPQPKEEVTNPPMSPPIVQTKKEALKEAEQFLTLEQASKECGLSRGLFKKLVPLCNFPKIQVGKKIVLIKKSDLLRWINVVKSVFA